MKSTSYPFFVMIAIRAEDSGICRATADGARSATTAQASYVHSTTISDGDCVLTPLSFLPPRAI